MRAIPHLSNPFGLLTLTAVLLAAPLGGPSAKEDQSLTPIPDKPPAPVFDLKDPQDRPQRLADYRGKPIILNFWATWCPPCREEMPSMQRAHQAVAPEGIAVIAINVGEDADTVGQFLADYPVDFPLPLDLDSQVAQRYPMKGLPTTFVIDAEGRLVYSAIGGRHWDDPKLLDQVRALKVQ
jgi:thiol-disulfide isomerase/thioredoxin